LPSILSSEIAIAAAHWPGSADDIRHSLCHSVFVSACSAILPCPARPSIRKSVLKLSSFFTQNILSAKRRKNQHESQVLPRPAKLAGDGLKSRVKLAVGEENGPFDEF